MVDDLLYVTNTPPKNLTSLILLTIVTFSAATIVFASQLCSSGDNGRASADDSLSLAVEIFKHYAVEVESATRAIQVLDDFQKRLSRGIEQGSFRNPHLSQIRLLTI